ncbi:MAG: DUF58 domain-containing protein [Steroidobacteraceae bacterium]
MLRARLLERAAAWARRRQGDDQTPLILQARRVYILPTRAGVAFSVLLFVMLVAGLNYTNSLALLLTFILVGFMLAGMYECQRTLQGLELRQARALDSHVGSTGVVELRLANRRRAPRRALCVRCHEMPGTRFDMAGGATDTVQLFYRSTRRGRVSIDRLELATTAPFGLFRAWTWLHLPLVAIVYPRPAGQRALPRSGAAVSVRATQVAGSDEEEWSSLRAFNPGDNPHRIAWKVYARGGALMVGQYEGSGGDEHLLSFAGLEDLDLEARLSQLAAWALICAQRGAACGLQLPGCQLPIGRGAEHQASLQRALALFGEAPP